MTTISLAPAQSPVAAYITPADIVQYLDQLDLEDAETEAALEAVALRATGLIDAQLGFHFDGYEEASARAVTALPGPWLYLPAHEPGSVSLVETAGGTDLVGLWEEVVESHGRVHKLEAREDGYLWDWTTDRDAATTCGLSPYWYWPATQQRRRRATYQVTARWGYGDPPAAIEELAIEVAVNIWRSKDSGGFAESIGVRSGGAVNISRYVAGLNDSQTRIVDAIREQYRPDPPLEAMI